jgi:hypothetical protein
MPLQTTTEEITSATAMSHRREGTISIVPLSSL